MKNLGLLFAALLIVVLCVGVWISTAAESNAPTADAGPDVIEVVETARVAVPTAEPDLMSAALPIVDRIREITASPKAGATLCERVAAIAGLGDEARPPLSQLIEAGEEPMKLHLTAAGFLASQGDSALLPVVEAVAWDESNPYRTEALLALLRVGDDVADRTLARLQGLPDDGVLREVLAVVWQLDDAQQLLAARNALQTAADAAPTTPLGQTLQRTILPQLDLALSVAQAPGSPSALKTLDLVLQRRDPRFATITGGVAQIWAAEVLAGTGLAAAAEPLRQALSLADEGTVSTPDHVRGALLSALARLDQPLLPHEAEWLANHPGAGQSLLLTLDNDDLQRSTAPRSGVSNG